MATSPISSDKYQHRLLMSKVKRRDLAQFLLLVGVIFLGLLSRKYGDIFPFEIQKYPGSGLWALAVFVAVGLLLPNETTLKVAAYAIVIAFAVEFSQLLSIPWLNAVRATKVGHLFLGSTFNPPDFVAYALGIFLGAGCKAVFFRKSQRLEKRAENSGA
jgi:Protein of unknown function (DUF2809)